MISGAIPMIDLPGDTVSVLLADAVTLYGRAHDARWERECDVAAQTYAACLALAAKGANEETEVTR